MKTVSPIRFEDRTKAFILSDEAKLRVEAAIADLNPEQLAAVLQTDGPVLVDAGAGTGKTKVLTTRIARLVARGYAVPERILAVTFTNKAATEMRERLSLLLGEEAANEVCMGSFHGVSLAILRKHAEEAGLRDADFRVFDEGDQLLAMHTAMEVAGVEDSWRRAGASKRDRSEVWNAKAKLLLDQVLAWKDEGRTVTDVKIEIGGLETVDPEVVETAKVYDCYQAELRRRNAVDFADILLLMVNLFRKNPEIRNHWSKRFSYLLVDEFQDTDGVQYEWIMALAEVCQNLFVVGDLDQSIYEWRNAKPIIFANFAQNWSGCHLIRLHRNYRSTQPILDIASAVAEKSIARASKERLQSGKTGGPVDLKSFDTSIEEATWIAQDVLDRIMTGTSASEIAILFRQSKDMAIIEQELAHKNIPYSVVSGTRFHKREEVKDILSWVAVAIDPTDELALFRAFQRPTTGIEDSVFDRALVKIKNGMRTAEALMETAAFDQYASQVARESLQRLAAIITELEANAAGKTSHLINIILHETGYVAWRRRNGLAEEDLEDVVEAIAREAGNFNGTPAEFLQMFALLSEADSPATTEAVRLSTIHAAKGLEFDVVYVPCLEEGILPNDRSLKHARFIEEERHILYVALTRAKKVLVPSFSRNRRYKPSKHSRFIEEVGLITDGHRSLVNVTARSTNRYAAKTTIRPIKLVLAPRKSVEIE